MPAREEAKQLVDDFAARTTGGGLWLHIKRADLAAGLKERLDNPDKIDQGGASLCGPADYMWDLATDMPKLYAKAGIELWESGSTTVGTLKIKPSNDVMKHLVPATAAINAADWILLASLRDSDNWILDYQSESDDAAGITMPHSLASWMKDTGYTNVKNDTNTFVTKDVNNAKAASKCFSDGYRVCLFINANMLDTKTQDDRSLTPNHWVVLLSAINVAGSNVSFKIFTWGSERDVPAQGTLSTQSFLKNYYGYVACKL